MFILNLGPGLEKVLVAEREPALLLQPRHGGHHVGDAPHPPRLLPHAAQPAQPADEPAHPVPGSAATTAATGTWFNRIILA